MDLEECLLEDVLSSGAVARKTDQEPEQISVVPADECLEGIGIPASVTFQQLLVREFGQCSASPLDPRTVCAGRGYYGCSGARRLLDGPGVSPRMIVGTAGARV